MNFRNLQCFVTVLEKGSFTRAAKKLNTPKSSVSRYIIALEEELGTKLLHRGAKVYRRRIWALFFIAKLKIYSP